MQGRAENGRLHAQTRDGDLGRKGGHKDGRMDETSTHQITKPNQHEPNECIWRREVDGGAAGKRDEHLGRVACRKRWNAFGSGKREEGRGGTHLTCMKRWEAFDVHEDVKGGWQRKRWKAVGTQKEEEKEGDWQREGAEDDGRREEVEGDREREEVKAFGMQKDASGMQGDGQREDVRQGWHAGSG
ncbi:hypothetical protein NEOLEDRAFT_1146713 [Neolentinus lepideus HHB14362 ss-1]|uniref:Uncharacterized protein n=1 Tax=Neolentinus lepideus HHB14362 ss-1 TaxID=1314782 RepID=A0A165TU49_9AGAM|nr:hypothetical protein NEOLEDRAFT_1146713 [Neolentinus lepideus HHB14362 ss-1]